MQHSLPASLNQAPPSNAARCSCPAIPWHLCMACLAFGCARQCRTDSTLARKQSHPRACRAPSFNVCRAPSFNAFLLGPIIQCVPARPRPPRTRRSTRGCRRSCSTATATSYWPPMTPGVNSSSSCCSAWRQTRRTSGIGARGRRRRRPPPTRSSSSSLAGGRRAARQRPAARQRLPPPAAAVARPPRSRRPPTWAALRGMRAWRPRAPSRRCARQEHPRSGLPWEHAFVRVAGSALAPCEAVRCAPCCAAPALPGVGRCPSAQRGRQACLPAAVPCLQRRI